MAASSRGLRPKPTPGRPPRLSGGQQRKLVRILARGPRRAGYPTDLWTLARVAKVIQREFGIRYHPSHVWKMLTARGWRCQLFELSEATTIPVTTAATSTRAIPIAISFQGLFQLLSISTLLGEN